MKKTIAKIGLFLAIFTNSLMFTVVFPMASQMVMYFGKVDNRSETGYWVGMIGGSMMIGRFMSAPAWGWLCDHWGRRPTLLIGITTTSLLAFLFGLSSTFNMALLLRFLQGLLSPITVVTRTIISEIYSGKEQASAMSWFILIGSIGNITGNIVGGFFNEPADSSIQLFKDHPYLLPNSIIGIAGVVSLALCYFCLDETKPKETLLETRQGRKFLDIIRDPIVASVTFMYIACSANGTGFGELLVLWLWAKRKNGGFEFTTGEIGIVSACTSLVYMMYVKFLYKWLTDRYGITKVSRNGLLVNIPAVLLFPFLTYARYTDFIKYVLIILSAIIYNTIEFMSITSSLIMLNNAVDSSERGKLNGFSLAVGNLGRGISPPFFGAIFASTATSDNPFPFNFALAFIILSIFIFIAWRISIRLNSCLDFPKNHKLEDSRKIEQEMAAVSIVEEREVD